MADKITYNDKSHVLPYGTREIQVWDLDMNEIKAVVNANADALEGIEGGYQGNLLIADIPIADGYYLAGESGTYTNAGGVVVDLTAGITFINVSVIQTVFSTTVIPVDTIPTGDVVEGETLAVSGGKVFLADSPFINSATVGSVMLDAILDVKINNADNIKNYSITIFRKNVSGTFLWEISVYDFDQSTPTVFGTRVAEWKKTSYTPTADIENIKIPSITNDDISLDVKVDWSNVPDNTSITGLDYTEAGLERKCYLNDSQLFDIVVSSDTGYVKYADDKLSFKQLIFTLHDSSKIVYLNDLTNVTQSSTTLNEVDISSLSNQNYLYISKSDFKDAVNSSNINIKVGTTWFSADLTDVYVLGIIQTVGSTKTYIGDIFDSIKTVGWNDVEYNNSLGVEGYNLNNFSNFRYKTASIENGNNESLVIALHGDSWTQVTDLYSRYTTYISRYLRSKYGDGGGGFYDFSASNGLRFMQSIDEADASDTRSGTITYLDEIDGAVNCLGVNVAHAVFGTGSTINLNVLTAHEKFVIQYYGGATYGTFRYRIDGGTWQNVDASLTTSHQTIDEVVSDATHLIEFEVLTGNVILFGVDMQRTYGVRVHKFGNRGLRSINITQMVGGVWESSLSAFGEIDCFTTLMGTNDKSDGVTPTNLKIYLKSILDKVNTSYPFIDFGYICPSNNEVTNTYPMSDYSNVMYNLAVENNVSFVGLIPLFGSTAKILNKGTFYDSYHPLLSGGKSISNLITEKLLK